MLVCAGGMMLLYAAIILRYAAPSRSRRRTCKHPLRNQRHENTISMQLVPGMRFLAFDFGAYPFRKSHARRRDVNTQLRESSTYMARRIFRADVSAGHSTASACVHTAR
eukprot:456541-Rhodomonas_salina.1